MFYPDDHDVLSFLTFQLTEPGKEAVSIPEQENVLPLDMWGGLTGFVEMKGLSRSFQSLVILYTVSYISPLSPNTFSLTQPGECCSH